MNHQVNHGQVDHSFTTGWQRLVVLAQPPILAKPPKGPFHYPTSGQYYETMQVTTPDNLNNPSECASGPIYECPTVASIDPDPLQSPKSIAQFLHDKSASITILNVGRMYHYDQDQPKCINEQVPLTPRNLLSSVITATPPFSAVLTLWLSRIPALGVGLRPALRRTCSRRRS
jgi:hypothetical protein